MDFALNDEQKDILKLAKQILTDQVTPEVLHKYDMWKEPRYDGRLWSTVADAGLLGIAIPDEHGGMGFGLLDLCLFLEECGRVLAPIPALPSTISALVIQKFGDADTQKMLGGVATGEVVLTAAFHEESNHDVNAPFTKASGGKLNGSKQCVPYANIATRMLVTATENGEACVYLVDPKAAGVTLAELKATTYEPQFNVSFEDAPATKLGGKEAMKYLVERYTVALCAYQSGVAEKMVDLTAKYTAEREQFNMKIATFQAVGHRAANCYIDAKCLKLVTQQAIYLLEQDLDATSAVHVAKIWLGDACHRISYATQHLHGGMGVDRDYPLWRFGLWAKQNELTLGNSTYHQIKLGDQIAAGHYDIDK